MADYDGTIKLSVGLDPKEAIQSAQNLSKKIENILSQSSGKEPAQFKKLEAAMDADVSKADELIGKMRELETNTSAYDQLISKLNAATDSLDSLNAQQEKLSNLGPLTVEQEKDLAALDLQAQNTVIEIRNIVAAMEQLEAQGLAKDVPEENAAAYQNLGEELNQVNNRMRINIEAASQFGAVGKKAADIVKNSFQKFLGVLKNVGSKIGSVFSNLISKATSSKSSMGELGKSVSSVFKKFLSLGLGIGSIAMLFNKLRAGITDGLKAMAMWEGGNNSANASISMLISSLNYLKASLGAAFAPILSVVAPILSAFMDMLARAAQMVGAFFAALTGGKTYVAASKINTNYAASQMKSTANTKKDTKETKKNTKAKKDNAKATKDQNDKLADFDDLNVLGKETQDDLNDSMADEPKIEEPKIETPEIGGGGGGVPIAGFEEKDIPGWIQGLVDRIKKAWENADFTGIGRTIGLKMRDALNSAADWLKDVAQPFAEKLGKSIATFLNGFFETPGLASALGRAIGEAINTAFAFIASFLDNTHFDSIGKFISSALMSVLTTVDWGQIGHVFAQKWNAIFDLLGGFAERWNPAIFANALGNLVNTAINDFNWAENAQSLSNFATKLLDTIIQSIEAVDWSKLGSGIATFISNIDWESIATKTGEALAKAVNAAVDVASGIITGIDFNSFGDSMGKGLTNAILTIDWNKLGQTLADGVNGLVDAIVGFLEGTDFKACATAIGEGLSTAFTALDFKDAARGLGDIAIAIVDTLTGLIEGIEWWSVGEALIQGIADVITGVDWSRLTASLAEFIGAAVGGLLAFAGGIGQKVWEFIVAAWEAYKQRVYELCFKNGEFSIQGWLEGQLELMKSVGTWIYDHIFKPFIDGFKSAFGIASPSKVMEELGKFLIEGLFLGIQSLVSKVIELWTKLKDKIAEVWTAAKAKVEEITTNLRTKVAEIFEAIKSKATEIWTALKTKVETLITTLKTNLTNLFTTLKTKAIEIWTDLKNKVQSLVTAFKEKLESLITLLKDKLISLFTTLKNKATEIWTNLKTAIETLVQQFKEAIESKINLLKDAILKIFNTLKTEAEKKWNEIKTAVTDVVENAKKEVEKIFTDLKDAVAGPNGIFHKLIGEAEDKWNEIKKAITDVVDKLSDKLVGSDGIITKMKKSFIDTITGIKEGIAEPIEGIKSAFNSIGDSAKSAINTAIGALKAIKIQLPDWDIIPASIRGKSWSPGDGLNYLAKGAVIPPNHEFLAVLGDQKQGTNIEAPLSTIEQAVRNVLGEQRTVTPSQSNATMVLDGQVFARLVVPHVMDELNRRGYNVKVLEA